MDSEFVIPSEEYSCQLPHANLLSHASNFFFCENFLLLIISHNNVGLEQKASKSLQ